MNSLAAEINSPAQSRSNLYQVLVFLFHIIRSEIFIWSAALIYLAIFNNPQAVHFSICPLNHLGIEFCPGCGLGNSISWLFHGDLTGSINAHPFGIPAVIILLNRIFTLAKQKGSNYAKCASINA